jgi:hypothetical protein
MNASLGSFSHQKTQPQAVRLRPCLPVFTQIELAGIMLVIDALDNTVSSSQYKNGAGRPYT